MKLTWLEEVWMEVQAEIDAEEWAMRHEAEPDPSDCSCFGSDELCVRCRGTTFGTSDE